jgi:hypothetical protein
MFLNLKYTELYLSFSIPILVADLIYIHDS